MKTAKSAFFDGISDEEFNVVSEKIKLRFEIFSRDEIIWVYGNGKGDGKLCYLADGIAEITRTDESGAVALVEKLSADSLFGFDFENKFFERDYVAVVAKTKCTVGFCEITKEMVNTLPPVVMYNVLQMQSKRVSEYAKRTSVLLGRTIRDKLMLYFNFCAEESGKNSFDLKMTLTGLADYIFADRSAMMREIKKLREEGVITINRKTVVINEKK